MGARPAHALQPRVDRGLERLFQRHPRFRDPGYERVDHAVSAHPTVAALSESDRRVLQLRIADGPSQREIAKRVGVSQMEVSRILARALARLREAVGEQPG